MYMYVQCKSNKINKASYVHVHVCVCIVMYMYMCIFLCRNDRDCLYEQPQVGEQASVASDAAPDLQQTARLLRHQGRHCQPLWDALWPHWPQYSQHLGQSVSHQPEKAEQNPQKQDLLKGAQLLLCCFVIFWCVYAHVLCCVFCAFLHKFWVFFVPVTFCFVCTWHCMWMLCAVIVKCACTCTCAHAVEDVSGLRCTTYNVCVELRQALYTELCWNNYMFVMLEHAYVNATKLNIGTYVHSMELYVGICSCHRCWNICTNSMLLEHTSSMPQNPTLERMFMPWNSVYMLESMFMPQMLKYMYMFMPQTLCWNVCWYAMELYIGIRNSAQDSTLEYVHHWTLT